MFRNGFDFKVNNSILDQNGHYIILDLTVYEQRLTLVCLYGYNTDNPEDNKFVKDLIIQMFL
jgi:hypothetical protein